MEKEVYFISNEISYSKIIDNYYKLTELCDHLNQSYNKASKLLSAIENAEDVDKVKVMIYDVNEHIRNINKIIDTLNEYGFATLSMCNFDKEIDNERTKQLLLD